MNLSPASEYVLQAITTFTDKLSGVALLSMRQNRIVIGDAVTGKDGTVEGHGVGRRLADHDAVSANIKLSLMLSSKIQ